MKTLFIALLALSAFAAEPSKSEQAKPVILTPADREPAHSALEALVSAQSQFLQLQLRLPELQKAYDAEVAKLKTTCGSDLVIDAKGLPQCAPKTEAKKPAEPPAK